MTSFLVEKTTKRSFSEKITKFTVKTQQNINASRNSFAGFCAEYYDGRSENDIFAELKTLKGNEQAQAIKDVLQSWIDVLGYGISLILLNVGMSVGVPVIVIMRFRK